jgi:microcystin-dependent protein
MTLFTPCAGLPYPERSDPPDVQLDMENLALAVDSAVCGAIDSYVPVGSVIAWWDAGNSPLPDGKLRCDGSLFVQADYPLLAAHLGNTTLPDLRGRFLRGADATFINGQTGGSATSSAPAHTHSLAAHTHGINHTHTAGTAASAGNHAHSIAHNHGTITSGSHVPRINQGIGFTGNGGLLSDLDISSNFSTANSEPHTHSVSIPNYSGNSGTTGAHTHSVSVPAYSGNSGAPSVTNTGETGSGSANSNLPPFTGIEFLMQAT